MIDLPDDDRSTEILVVARDLIEDHESRAWDVNVGSWPIVRALTLAESIVSGTDGGWWPDGPIAYERLADAVPAGDEWDPSKVSSPFDHAVMPPHNRLECFAMSGVVGPYLVALFDAAIENTRMQSDALALARIPLQGWLRQLASGVELTTLRRAELEHWASRKPEPVARWWRASGPITCPDPAF